MLFELVFTILLIDGTSFEMVYHENFNSAKECRENGDLIAEYFSPYFGTEFPAIGMEAACNVLEIKRA